MAARLGSGPLTRTELGELGPFPALVRRLTRFLARAWRSLHHLVAFSLITLGVLARKALLGRSVIRMETRRHMARLTLRLLPMILIMSAALGFVVIGQSVSLLDQIGARNWLGTVMVATVVREIGPLLAALVVLARSGTANVVELGMARISGEVESLEAAGIDPVHFMVAPRVVALALGTFALTIYLILGTLLSGYLWAFLEDVPILPGQYFAQLGAALHGLDFAMLVGKSLCFGIIIALVTSYQGMAHRLRPEDISGATVRAVVQSLLLCMMTELGFMVFYLAL